MKNSGIHYEEREEHEGGLASGTAAEEPMGTASLFDLQAWCRDYERRTAYPASVMNRFAIGFYQIYQGMEWKDGLNRAESYCSAFLHFLMVAERLQVPTELLLPDKLSGMESTTMERSSMELLKHLSRAQQHLVYGNNPNKTGRNKRYNLKTLSHALSEALKILMQLVDPALRKEGLHHAMKIMSGKI
jgi:hypothetical protein